MTLSDPRLSRQPGGSPSGGAKPTRKPSGLWGGRFEVGTAPELDRLNRSLPVDWRLWPYELAVDRAWAVELREIGALTEEHTARLLTGLDAVAARMEAGDPAEESDEDVHSLVERWLGVEVGELASQVRLGRSRNDVVATDTRLWTLGAVERTLRAIRELQSALLEQAEAARDVPFPLWSHLQRAQPSRSALWFLAHFWALERDGERLRDARRRVASLPLGAAAGAGTTLPVDRERLARHLGLDAPCENSLDAVGARDWAAEVLFAWTQTALDLSRLGEELVLLSSGEFGLVRLGDAWSTGSSLLPHKRNPDGAELARGRAGTLLGLLTGFLAVLKSVPAGYAKDLQEDKAALFSAEDGLLQVLPALAGTVRGLRIDVDAVRRAIGSDLLTADLAERLALDGVPFARAHRAVGELVKVAEETGRSVAELTPEERAAIHPALRELPEDVWSLEAALERRTATGGTARNAVERQLAAARARLEARA